jgi:FdhE protein
LGWPTQIIGAMQASSYQSRVQRAQHLASKYEFAAEILGFYIHIAGFQEDLQRRLNTNMQKSANNGYWELSRPALGVLVPEFREFLNVCRQHGPQKMEELETDLLDRGPDFHATLMNETWTGHSPPGGVGLLAEAFLQPYAELLRLQAGLKIQNYTFAVCPFCNRRPAAGVLRPLGEGAARWLLCSFCLMEWEFRRILCAACGEQASQKLPVYRASEFEHVRVECCDTCKTYIKTIDLSKDGHAEPLVDELASVPLDLWARDRGYAKLQNNLFGM